jgi:hypothetical protein
MKTYWTNLARAALFRATRIVSAALALAIGLSFSGISVADEGGVSFWLPGQFGSLARGSSVSARKSDTFSRPETCKAM